jgi:hypothetical protein
MGELLKGRVEKTSQATNHPAGEPAPACPGKAGTGLMDLARQVTDILYGKTGFNNLIHHAPSIPHDALQKPIQAVQPIAKKLDDGARIADDLWGPKNYTPANFIGNYLQGKINKIANRILNGASKRVTSSTNALPKTPSDNIPYRGTTKGKSGPPLKESSPPPGESLEPPKGDPLFRPPEVSKGRPPAYKTNPSGQILEAEGTIEGSHPGRSKGSLPEPVGGKSPGDHAGHLLPEGSAQNPAHVNVPKNLVSETPASNLRLKRQLDNYLTHLADEFPNSNIVLRAQPLTANATRPYAVQYAVFRDGQLIRTLSIYNPP